MELRRLRQLEDQHRDLMRRRRSVELELSALGDLGTEGAESEAMLMRAMSLLTALRRELQEHFSLEESVGFLKAATEAAPRLSRRAGQIGREHAEMDAALGEILDGLLSSQTSPDRWPGLAESFAEFSRTLRVHEQAEEQVLREAFMDDLGGGD
jgi:iron-sulfur cluster repair protein YtfE (RIC family)